MEYTDNRLPESWVPAVLRDVVTGIVGGGTPDKSQKHYYQGSIPWMTVKDMHQDVLDDTIDHISPEAVANSSTKLIPANTPIVATRMSLGKIVRAPFTVAINQDLKAIFLNESVDGDYFVYWYRSIAQHIENMGTGTTVKGIRLENLYTLQIPLPPLPEQHYIAGRLDNLLARADAVQARLQGLPTQLKHYRQAVLAAAVSGDLTADWRERTGATEAETLSIAKVASLSVKKKKLDDDLSVSFSSMHLMSEKLGEPLQFEERKWSEVKKGFTFFEENDVLLAKITPCFENGKNAIARNLINGIGTGSTEFMVLRPNERVLPEYLLYNISTQHFITSGVLNMTGSVGHKRVPKEFVENWQILLPTLPEQTEIVRRVEKLLAHADTVEQAVTHSLQQLALLKQSLLARAFSGELSAAWRAKAN